MAENPRGLLRESFENPGPATLASGKGGQGPGPCPLRPKPPVQRQAALPLTPANGLRHSQRDPRISYNFLGFPIIS